ncbi:hypothetical protein POSPLADRAFT_1055801 [Postia placenta MAD-698-R-SB12]|uniref:Uncharacterized protein n=1 Tax=Postia placenta MAD-698-R-SB12 TaxID=670580 RepID=A0A1X6N5G9_9APHY|nr:hypothetical protein POSPLADRAFT_1055801 [Postia placenta MAD-698-R-SB12]OSX63722.1 hypothetical protein POSPLADRAFT_1055801 [Postia placenta MAD-698-R-SB12]
MSAKSQSQYAPASKVPLIKSPSLRVPRPVERPPDIHPLPDDVTAYFVYPFTLEPHVIRLEESRRSTLIAHATRREAYLRAREEEKERRKREALRRIAPGFEPQASPLVPTKRASLGPGTSSVTMDDTGHARSRSVMEDLVDQLAKLDS